MGVCGIRMSTEKQRLFSEMLFMSTVGLIQSLVGCTDTCPGQPWPYLSVEPRKYRLRILNHGLSRDYVFNFTTDKDITNPLKFSVIASDSGLLRYPVETTTLATSVG